MTLTTLAAALRASVPTAGRVVAAGHRGRRRTRTSGPGRKTASGRRSYRTRRRRRPRLDASMRATSAGAWPTGWRCTVKTVASTQRTIEGSALRIFRRRCPAGFLIRRGSTRLPSQDASTDSRPSPPSNPPAPPKTQEDALEDLAPALGEVGRLAKKVHAVVAEQARPARRGGRHPARAEDALIGRWPAGRVGREGQERRRLVPRRWPVVGRLHRRERGRD